MHEAMCGILSQTSPVCICSGIDVIFKKYVLDVCLCLGCGGVGGRVLGTGCRKVEWCYVCVSCRSEFCV